ncbi:MAG: peroxidase-related enzyme [Bacteroidetes bacterium]|nr:peroxidase-related enzyme [Bacteroidota bacterium]
MTWIRTIDFDKAEGKLKRLYDRVKGPGDNVDNIMLAHSLRPHSMEGHMALYKNVLHHADNTVEKWFLEALGVFVSHQNQCDYCVDHHFEGMKRLLQDEKRSAQIWEALTAAHFEIAFSQKEVEAFRYARRLTLTPVEVGAPEVESLRDLGWTDGEILEINQVVAYFNYANRTVLGLGVSTEGDNLGLSPGDSSDPDNWQHH